MSVEFLLFTHCIKLNMVLILIFVTVRENFENLYARITFITSYNFCTTWIIKNELFLLFSIKLSKPSRLIITSWKQDIVSRHCMISTTAKEYCSTNDSISQSFKGFQPVPLLSFSIFNLKVYLQSEEKERSHILYCFCPQTKIYLLWSSRLERITKERNHT